MDPILLLKALILGIVEGLTEFVPVSSTGHLILMSRVLGLRGPAIDAFSVVVQLGALLAAVFYYRRILIDTLTGVLRRQPESLALVRNILLGSLPLLEPPRPPPAAPFTIAKNVSVMLPPVRSPPEASVHEACRPAPHA